MISFTIGMRDIRKGASVLDRKFAVILTPGWCAFVVGYQSLTGAIFSSLSQTQGRAL